MTPSRSGGSLGLTVCKLDHLERLFHLGLDCFKDEIFYMLIRTDESKRTERKTSEEIRFERIIRNNPVAARKNGTRVRVRSWSVDDAKVLKGNHMCTVKCGPSAERGGKYNKHSNWLHPTIVHGYTEYCDK